MQPSVTVLGKEGAPISDLGHKSDPWQVTASLSGAPPGAILIGTTTVPYRNSTATFTDLSVSKPGEGYNLSFTITFPSYAPVLTATLVETFSSTQMSAAMVLQQPSIVQARQPIAITVQFVDEDSGLVLDGQAFKGQTFVGELLAKTAEGH
ncbi:fibrocystin-like [Scylla paramamosain]